MSAFIVNDLTIDRIVSFIYWERDCFFKPEVEKIFKEVGYFLDEKGIIKLAKDIKALNWEAVYKRYEGRLTREENQEVKKYKPYLFFYHDINQVFNHVRCLTYQLNENDISETPLYQALEKLEKALAYKIAREASKNCEWEAKENEVIAQ